MAGRHSQRVKRLEDATGGAGKHTWRDIVELANRDMATWTPEEAKLFGEYVDRVNEHNRQLDGDDSRPATVDDMRRALTRSSGPWG
jgi:hypothetical protein